MDALRACIETIQREVRNGLNVSSNRRAQLSRELLACRSRAEWLQRKVRPVSRIVKCMGGEAQQDLARYYADVHSQLEHVAEDCTTALRECDALVDELREMREFQQSEIVYHLTVVATLQWVWTFLTGIYGMNFVDEDGHPTVPLLGRMDVERGTWMFWYLGLFLTLCIFLYCKFVLRPI